MAVEVILNETDNLRRIKDLSYGDVFVHAGNLYVKTKTHDSIGYDIISIGKDTVMFMTPNFLVTPVKRISVEF